MSDSYHRTAVESTKALQDAIRSRDGYLVLRATDNSGTVKMVGCAGTDDLLLMAAMLLMRVQELACPHHDTGLITNIDTVLSALRIRARARLMAAI